MATVYVEITDNYSRTVWDNTGATNYVIGDRIEYNDGSQNIIFVCITDNNSTTTPDINTSDWVEAGSEEYPFLVSSAISTTNFCNLDETTSTLGEYALYSSGTNFAVEAAESQGEIILGDGEYRWTRTKGASYVYPNFNNVNIKAKNQLKAYIRGHFTRYNNCARAENLVLVNEYTPWNYVFGKHSTTPSSLIGCLITQETPTFKLKPIKQESSSSDQSRPITNMAAGSIIRNCTFDFSYFGPSYWFDISSVITVENNTFYTRVKHNQYNAVYLGGGSIFKNNIFYYKYLNDLHLYQSFTYAGMSTIGANILYVENPVSAAGGSIDNNIPGGQTINPLFIDAENGNFSLRPSSPLIGGVKEQNKLAQKYPNGLWVDHNHSPTQTSYNYTLNSGDGNNYTFSGDAIGTDPALSVNIQDTLTFTNNTGGHPLAIYNSQGVEVASESGGSTAFTPKYPDTYYYQCTASGHENMRGDIVVSKGSLGSYDNPFGSMHDAIDAGYYDNSATLLFKEGDHLMSWYPGTGYHNNSGISSPFPGGLFFIGEDSNTTRLTTGNNFNGYPAFYVGDSLFPGSSQSQTPLTVESVGFYVNNTISYLNRGLFSGLHWKSFTFKRGKVSCSIGGAIKSNLLDNFYTAAPDGYEFTLSGCEFNVPLSDTNGPGGTFLSGAANIKFSVDSCSFVKLPGYNYVHNGPSPIMVGPAFNISNGSYVKNSIFYSGVGGDFSTSSVSSGIFSSCVIHSTTNSFVTLPQDMSLNSSDDPLFIKPSAGEEDLRLKPKSGLIGGLKKQETNVYYLQPGNPLNGDGSQKDSSAMVSDGDPGPFNAFKNIVAAGVPYGSKIIILNGTYSWPNEFIRKNPSIWEDYTYEGYNYKAETSDEVIFDANKVQKYLGYMPFGGTPGAGQILDLDTSFTGIQFNNVVGNAEITSGNQIFTSSSGAGFGSCTFNSCKFLGWINTGYWSYPWTGGGRNQYGSTMHWKGCAISIAFDYEGGLLSGGDGFADDEYHGAWSWENCTFYIPVGLTTFNGRNAANGTYASPYRIFGNNYTQSQRIFKNNIVYIPGGNTSTGTLAVENLPSMKNNCLVGVVPGPEHFDFINDNNLLDVDPKFINPENNNFKLRPNSLLVGRGV